MKIVKIETIDDWMIKVKGFYPKKTLKISELTYPLEVQLDEVNGTFEIYVPKKEVKKQTKKDKFGIYVQRFVFIVILLALICILGFSIGEALL